MNTPCSEAVRPAVEPLDGRDWAAKTVVLTLEAIGLFAGIFAVLIGSRSLLSPFLRTLNDHPGFLAACLSEITSAARWAVLCVITVALVLMVRKAKSRWSLADLGFRTHGGWRRDLRSGLIVFSVSYLATLPLHLILLPSKAALAGPGFARNMAEFFSSIWLGAAAVVLLAASEYVGAFWEEIFWRGYVQSLFSRELAPVAGFLAAAIFFGLGHYFTRPEWGLLDVLLALIVGIVLGLVYHLTGSIFVSAIVHALVNGIWTYPFYAHVRGATSSARAFILGLGAFCLIVIMASRKDVLDFARRARELFARASPRAAAAGIGIGIVFLLYEWGQSRMIRGVNRAAFVSILGVFALSALGLSHILARSFHVKPRPSAGDSAVRKRVSTGGERDVTAASMIDPADFDR